MLRLPRFKYLRPKTAREAARMASDLGPRAMFVAGGTDLFPKLKRRQFDVEALIDLAFLPRTVHRGEDERRPGENGKEERVKTRPGERARDIFVEDSHAS